MLHIILSVLSSLLVAAHFLRDGATGLVAVSLIFPILFIVIKRPWTYLVNIIFYGFASLLWLQTAAGIFGVRQAMGEPAGRMLVIMGSVSLFTLFSAYSVHRYRKKKHPLTSSADGAAFSVFVLSFALLAFVRWKVTAYPMLLFDRFLPGAGWLQILALSIYGAVVAEKMMDPKNEQKMRLLIWKVFSVVFFLQLILGLTLSSIFLMTGELHIPVPALIIAGPLYRGEGLFMPILFLSTIILVGPAWCSHLCYFGAWDNAAAHPVKRPKSLRKWAEPVRIIILILIILTALLFRSLGIPPLVAAISGTLFGLLGVAVMVFISRRTGTMAHCTAYCPIGLFAVILGRINPFRIQINDSCTDCNACTRICRFDALNPENIKKRKAAYTCTLCGDCIASCHTSALEYRFMNLSPDRSRQLFLILIISLHAVFMGLARI